jgi:hypothetical protein
VDPRNGRSIGLTEYLVALIRQRSVVQVHSGPRSVSGFGLYTSQTEPVSGRHRLSPRYLLWDRRQRFPDASWDHPSGLAGESLVVDTHLMSPCRLRYDRRGREGGTAVLVLVMFQGADKVHSPSGPAHGATLSRGLLTRCRGRIVDVKAGSIPLRRAQS